MMSRHNRGGGVVSNVAQPGEAADVTGAAPEQSLERPTDRPGPMSGLARRLEAMGWRGWLLVPGVAAAQFAWAHAVLWAAGRLEPWSIDQSTVIFLVYAPFALAACLIGRQIARRSVAAFWPATGWPDGERSRWVQLFERGSARLEWAALAIGVAITGGWLAGASSELIGSEPGRLASYVAYAPLVVAGYGFSSLVGAIGLRWLVLVDRIHGQATAIDVFDRAPIYAFSRLTVYLGIAIAAAMYYTLAVNGSAQADNVGALLFDATAVPFAIVAFVAPLWGIHNRLVREKDQLLLDVERRITRLGAEMYARIDAGAFDSTKVINDSLGGLTALRDRIAHLPTWPWEPQLFRGFVSALLLPIVLFLLTRVISDLISA
jgi:hypothetical protein